MKQFYVYILASGRNGTLYTGVTSDLRKRIYEHTNKVDPNCFTAKYDVHCLVYYEVYEDFEQAVRREKNIKAWKRAWKIEEIEKNNPRWLDLYDEICK